MPAAMPVAWDNFFGVQVVWGRSDGHWGGFVLTTVLSSTTQHVIALSQDPETGHNGCPGWQKVRASGT